VFVVVVVGGGGGGRFAVPWWEQILNGEHDASWKEGLNAPVPCPPLAVDVISSLANGRDESPALVVVVSNRARVDVCRSPPWRPPHGDVLFVCCCPGTAGRW
jgi:hypothetical protein